MTLPIEFRTTAPKIIHDYSKVNKEALVAFFQSFASKCLETFNKRSLEANWNMLKLEFKRIKSTFVPKIVLKTNA